MAVVEITFLKYEDFGSKVWAFGMMQFAHRPLSTTKGLLSYKLMGSGKDLGFNPWPDWSTYSIMMIWESREDADAFWASSPLAAKYKSHAVARWSVYMHPTKSYGKGGGSNMFEPYIKEADTQDRVAVVTRATMKWSKIIPFWKTVPSAQKGLFNNDHVLFTKGVGEVPLRNMVTFSIWDSADAVNHFAYKSDDGHKQAMQAARKHKWFKEDLFARFAILDEVGDSTPFVEAFHKFQKTPAQA